MAERLRSIDVKIEIDTNKETRRVELSMDEDESVGEFVERVERAIRARLPE